MDIYTFLTRFFPRRIKKDFNQLIMYSTIKIDPNKPTALDLEGN